MVLGRLRRRRIDGHLRTCHSGGRCEHQTETEDHSARSGRRVLHARVWQQGAARKRIGVAVGWSRGSPRMGRVSGNFSQRILGGIMRALHGKGVSTIAVVCVLAAVVSAHLIAQDRPQASPQATPAPVTGSGSPFAGRWEIVVQPPAGQMGPREMSFAILEISAKDGVVTGKIIDSIGAPVLTMTLSTFAVKDDQLEMTLEAMNEKIVFTGKRVGDHIEGKAVAAND